MFKTTFEKFPSKVVRCQSYKSFSGSFLRRNILSDANLIQSEDARSLQSVISKNHNTNTPFKKRSLRENDKLHITSRIRKQIKTRSRLKNQAKKIRKEEDIKAYKKQRSLVQKLNRKVKKDFL